MARVRGIVTIAIVAALCAAPAATAADLDEKAAAQIAALQEHKGSLSKAERKLDSRLAVTLRRRAGRPIAPRVTTGVEVSKSGATEVDVRARSVTGELLDRLESVGAVVEHASQRVDSVRATIPIPALGKVARWNDVRRVDVAVEAMTHQVVSEGDKAHAADLARSLHITGFAE